MWRAYEAKACTFDRETDGAIHFSVGSFMLGCSMLPPKLARLVSMLGYPSDRAAALQHLTRAHESGGIRYVRGRARWRRPGVRACTTADRQRRNSAPVAALALLFYHVILQSFFSIDAAGHIRVAEDVLRRNLERYPDSGLFLFMSGRLQRLKCDLPAALRDLSRAAEVQTEWPQLREVCYYDLGWTHFFLRQWSNAADYFGRLRTANEWSKCLYAYIEAVCLLAHGSDDRQAIELLLEAPSHVRRRWGGKIMSEEQFVVRKVRTYVDSSGCRLILPALELAYLWNGFTQLPRDLLQQALDEVDAWHNTRATATARDADAEAIGTLLRAALLKHLDRRCARPRSAARSTGDGPGAARASVRPV